MSDALDKVFSEFATSLRTALVKSADGQTATAPPPAATVQAPAVTVQAGTLEQLQRAVTDMTTKIDSALSALRIDESDPEKSGPVMKMIHQLSTDQDQVIEAVGKIIERTERLEGATAVRKSASGQDTDPPKRTSAATVAEKAAGASGQWDKMLLQMRAGRKVRLV